MLRRIVQVLTVIVLMQTNLSASETDALQNINARARVQYVKPEVLDQLMIELRPFENAPVPGQDSILFDTYRIIAASYIANNHFKQAYEVFTKYLAYKENALFVDKANSISNALNALSSQQKKDESEQKNIEDQLNQLKLKNIQLESDRRSFKRNFSFGLIILSSIFALMLVGTGIRMISIRAGLRQGNDKMKDIHRNSVVGKLEAGLKTSMQQSLQSVSVQQSEIRQSLSKIEQGFPPARKAGQLISGIEKIIKEISGKI